MTGDTCWSSTDAVPTVARDRHSDQFVAADRVDDVYGAHVPGETLIKYERTTPR
jgi:hypothetical protein